MFDIDVSEDVYEFARCLVAKHNLGHRGRVDGGQEQQLTGLIGQTVIHDLFSVQRPRFGASADSGVDFVFAGLRLDVKTTGRNVRPQPHYVSSLFQVQARSFSQVLLFCSLNKPQRVLTVCGWISKDEFLKSATLYPRGTQRERVDGTSFVTKASQYEIENRHLHSPASGAELKAALKREGASRRLAGKTPQPLQAR